jgi:hypothetical protein
MRTFYFVGGPTPGNEEIFFRRLAAAGGLPAGWSIPHVGGDGHALHIARVDAADAIAAHLTLFADIYQSTEPIEVTEGRDYHPTS